MGADCVPLIAALDDAELSDFHALAAVGLDALIEIHDERELERARCRGDLVGVNQRTVTEADQERRSAWPRRCRKAWCAR